MTANRAGLGKEEERGAADNVSQKYTTAAASPRFWSRANGDVRWAGLEQQSCCIERMRRHVSGLWWCQPYQRLSRLFGREASCMLERMRERVLFLGGCVRCWVCRLAAVWSKPTKPTALTHVTQSRQAWMLRDGRVEGFQSCTALLFECGKKEDHDIGGVGRQGLHMGVCRRQ